MACENVDVLVLECAAGEYIDVLDGFFGRKHPSECGDTTLDQSVSCEVENSREKVE